MTLRQYTPDEIGRFEEHFTEREEDEDNDIQDDVLDSQETRQTGGRISGLRRKEG